MAKKILKLLIVDPEGPLGRRVAEDCKNESSLELLFCNSTADISTLRPLLAQCDYILDFSDNKEFTRQLHSLLSDLGNSCPVEGYDAAASKIVRSVRHYRHALTSSTATSDSSASSDSSEQAVAPEASAEDAEALKLKAQQDAEKEKERIKKLVPKAALRAAASLFAACCSLSAVWRLMIVYGLITSSMTILYVGMQILLCAIYWRICIVVGRDAFKEVHRSKRYYLAAGLSYGCLTAVCMAVYALADQDVFLMLFRLTIVFSHVLPRSRGVEWWSPLLFHAVSYLIYRFIPVRKFHFDWKSFFSLNGAKKTRDTIKELPRRGRLYDWFKLR